MTAMAADGQCSARQRPQSADRARLERAAGGASRNSSAPRVGIRLDQPLANAIEDLERRFIEHALSSSGGRVAEAAQLLGLSRKGLFLKRRRQGFLES